MMKNKKEVGPSKQDRQNKPAGLRKSKGKGPLAKVLINDLLRCFSKIREVQQAFQELRGSDQDKYPFAPDTPRPWDDRDPERNIFRQRQAESTDRLLNRILADLLEVTSMEAGLRTIEPLIYTFPYSPPMPDEASDIR